MNPLHQFLIKPFVEFHILGFDVSFTNSSLFMLLSAILGAFILWALVYPQRKVPHTAQALIEALYRFISNTARDTIGPEYKGYIPFVFSVFIMIFINLFSFSKKPCHSHHYRN